MISHWEEGAEVFADRRELAITPDADDLIRAAGHVDVLVANPTGSQRLWNATTPKCNR
jgi:hypothetical protein